MSSYSQEELQGMTRVQLRRAAIAVLNIGNKEASNTKSGELIDRILEEEGGAGGNGTKKAASKKAPPKKTKASKAPATKTKAETATAPSTDGIGELVDAVGKAVDETKEELAEKLTAIQENQNHMMRQMFIMFGLICDVYKAVDEPDVLEERLEELDEEWNNQGNEG